MLRGWERKFPGRIESIAAAIQNVVPSQLGDADLFDFANLKIERNDAAIRAINLA